MSQEDFSPRELSHVVRTLLEEHADKLKPMATH